jgi:tetratricopeptide (TPR) repeat protein
MGRMFCIGVIIVLLQSCSSVDDANPESLLTHYVNLGFSKDYETRYEFISDKSKEVCTLGEYLDDYSLEDSLKPISQKILSLSQIQKDQNHPTYKRFKGKFQTINYKNDTIINLYYYTLKNENSLWRIVWTGTIRNQADEKFYSGEYDGAVNLYNKIIELDPFNAHAYSFVGWSYKRDESKDAKERKEIMLKNFRYAISLEPDNSNHYNSIASYYSMIDVHDLVVENYEKSIKLCLNDFDKVNVYGNLALTLLGENEYEAAELALEKALKIDSESTYTYYTFGQLYRAQDLHREALVKYNKALGLPPLDAHLQALLHSGCAVSCYFTEDYEKGMEQILKALELDPSDEYSISTYEVLKKKLAS